MDSAATQCQFCWRVREDGADARAVTQWGELATFLQKHEAQPQDLTVLGGILSSVQSILLSADTTEYVRDLTSEVSTEIYRSIDTLTRQGNGIRSTPKTQGAREP